MDTTGQIYMGVIIVVLVLSVVVFYVISKFAPTPAVLIIGVVLFTAGRLISESELRELHLLEGILRMVGILGMILGALDLIRKRPKPPAASPPPAPPGEDSNSTE